MPYLSASAVVIHYKEALYQVYGPLPLESICAIPAAQRCTSVPSCAEDLVEAERTESAEIEFFAELQDRIDEGQFVTTPEAEKICSNMMRDYGIKSRSITRGRLLQKIRENIICDITDSQGTKPSVIHCKKSRRAALDAAMRERDIKEQMLQIFKCAKNVRQAILNFREKENVWRFQETLLDYSDTDIPCELFSLIRWIIQTAQAATTLSRAKELRKKCTIMSQILVRECKYRR